MSSPTATTTVCPFNRAFSLVTDPAEVFPDDPGNGTPAMVYGPRGWSATYNCAISEGELTAHDGGTVAIPPTVLDWLEGPDCVDVLATVGY